MAKRRDEFVVGFPKPNQVVWGLDSGGEVRWAAPMKAKEVLEEGDALLGGATIYRLVEAPPAEVERQAARERRAKGKR